MHVTGPTSPMPPAAPAARPRADRAGAPAATAAPAGEPTLWELLTPEEREFFTQQAALGPLTYRADSAAAETRPGPVGQRVDVRA